MILKKFIEKLENLAEEYGNDIEVIMADNIPVCNPIFLENYLNKKSVVVTDED